MQPPATFSYGQDRLTARVALHLSSGLTAGILAEATRQKIQSSKNIVDRIAAGTEAVYGINTGFGPLCSTRISKEDTRQLQYNILKSHSVGVGDDLSLLSTKLMLILKVHALALGHSGIALPTLMRLLWHIEENIIPVVPQQGSVGASGDLAPLAHLFLPLIGLGQVWWEGKKIPAGEALRQMEVEPIELGPKEGIALINGTQFIAAHAVQIVDRLHNCLDHADIIGAMHVEALLGSARPFFPQLHQLRPFAGNQHVAHLVSILLEESEIMKSHEECDRVQDPYSLRCIPQVHGASRTAWLHLKELLEIELNAVTDNPVIIDEQMTISGGNFHGQPLALPLDYAGLAAAELGNISDRRCYLSLTGMATNVPRLLMHNTGINSGFMMLQYTTAALASENKVLCFPASADSIPTSLGQEDHVSMGSISGRKTLQIVENLEKILAIEMLCGAQALDFHRPLQSGKILGAIHECIREHITHADTDRLFAEDIEKAIILLRNRSLPQVARNAAQVHQLDYSSPFDQFENY